MYVGYATLNDIGLLRDLFNSTNDDEKYNLGLAGYFKLDDDIGFWSPMIIFKEGDEILGFVMLDYNTQNMSCSIDKLYVFPIHRQKGVAKALLKFCEHDCIIKNFSYIWMSVFEYNTNMQKRAINNGFEKVGERKYATIKKGERYGMVYYGKFINK